MKLREVILREVAPEEVDPVVVLVVLSEIVRLEEEAPLAMAWRRR